MKKVTTILATAIILFVSFSSCKKIVTAIFPGINARVPDVTITIPPVLFVPPGEVSLGTFSTSFNLDSVVRANSNGVFNANDISSVKLKSITITVQNSDNLNNLSNFEYTRLTLSSNTDATEAEVVTIKYPQSETSSITVTPENTPDIRPYLSGNQLNYTVYGQLRKPTTKPLTFVVSATARIE